MALGTSVTLVAYVVPMATVVATARDLGAGSAGRAWVLSAMSVGLAAFLLASGVVGDGLGRRRTYALGLATLGVAGVVAALAPSTAVLVVARVLQGAGGAAVLSCGLATLAHVFPPGPRRGHATAVWGASVAVGVAAGSVLTAVLDVGSGWRPSYWAVAAASLLLVPPSLRALPDSGAGGGRRIDVAGLGLLVVTMTAAVSALTQARTGVDAATLALAAVAVLALVAFVAVERRVAGPLLDPDLLGSSGFRAATLGSFTLGVGMIGVASFVPTMALVVLHQGLWGAAVPVLAWAGLSIVASLALRHAPWPLAGTAPIGILLVLVAGGMLLGLGVDASSGLTRLTLPFAVTGVFTGLINALLGREAVATVPPARAAMGSGANNTARYLGAACGITLVVSLANAAGGGPAGGWDLAVVSAAALTALGGAGVVLLGRERVAVPEAA